MNHLTETDVETIRAAIAGHEGDVILPRALLDILLADVRCWPARETLGFPYLATAVRKA